jgi:hypothetical protein
MEENYLEKALEVANLIKDENTHAYALRHISSQLAMRTEDYSQALEVAAKIVPGWERKNAYTTITFSLAQEGRFIEAFEVALKIEDLEERLFTFLDISELFQDAEKKSETELLIIEYMKAEFQACNDVQLIDQCIRNISRELLRRGKWQTLFELLEFCYDAKIKQELMSDIAIWHAEQGNFEKALEMAKEFQDPSRKDRCHEIICDCLMNKVGEEKPKHDLSDAEVDLSKIATVLSGNSVV